MDLKGSLLDTHLRIYPSERFIDFIQTIPTEHGIPDNFFKFFKNRKENLSFKKEPTKVEASSINEIFSDKDVENLNKIKDKVTKLKGDELVTEIDDISIASKDNSDTSEDITAATKDLPKTSKNTTEVNIQNSFEEILPEREGPYLLTSDIFWLYSYMETERMQDKDIPYLHELFEGSDIDTPRNEVLKRNPILEERCVKLRSQQEAREYRKMTKSVDNVRLRFPDDSISYQLKQINRQLIAIGQFIISIFAGFLFGFKGIEWTIGPLDFGFKLLLGVMCALIIALAEIYFLAKKLNEELSVPETTQLGGPPQFVDKKNYDFEPRLNKMSSIVTKEHQD